MQLGQHPSANIQPTHACMGYRHKMDDDDDDAKKVPSITNKGQNKCQITTSTAS